MATLVQNVQNGPAVNVGPFSNDIAGFGGVSLTALVLAGAGQLTVSGAGAISKIPSVAGTGKRGSIGTGAVTRAPVLAGTGTASVLPTTIALSAGNNQTATVNTAVPINPTVLVTGAGGVPAAGVLVTWTVTGGGGNVSPATSFTNANGLASTVWTMGPTAGTDTLQASANGPAQGGGTTLLTEGFEDGSIGGRGWFDDTSVPVVAGTRTGGSGVNVLQLHWTNGATTPIGVGAARYDFTPSDSLYLSYWVQHSTNWIGSGVAYHPHFIQITTTEDDHFSGSSYARLAIYDELLYLSGNLQPQLAIQDSKMINEIYAVGDVYVDRYGIDENHSIAGANGQHEVVNDGTSTLSYDVYAWPDPGEANDYGQSYPTYNMHTNYKLYRPATVIAGGTKNSWHHMESYWQLNTINGGVGQADGLLQQWIDGVQVMNRTAVMYRTGRKPTIQFRTILIAPYIGVGSPADQYMWIDDLLLRTTRP